MQILSHNHTARGDTVQNLKDLNSHQPLATPAKKGEKVVSMTPAIKIAFDLMTDDIVDLSTG